MLEEYIDIVDYPKYMDINKGDTIFISSDTKKILWDAIENQSDTDLNKLIDGLIERVGNEGTIIIPTFNWGFCKGETFDYKKTRGKTGTLGNLALKRNDFKRTKHPIYSFAVFGKYKNELCEMNNIDSFGEDSPFSFFREHNVKNYIIDVTLQHCFTFAHYAEEQSGVVTYRFIKEFQANYIDEYGRIERKTYSMFVRKMDSNVETLIDPIENDFISAGAEIIIEINSSKIRLIYMKEAYDIMMDDIIYNKARKLCSYNYQG